MSAKLKQCAEHGKGSKETLEKSIAELAQKHEQTKAVLSKSQHRELELQAQIAEVQSARASLQHQLSIQQAENDDLSLALRLVSFVVFCKAFSVLFETTNTPDVVLNSLCLYLAYVIMT